MANYIPTIGLEIHAELNTKSKMFCSCANVPLEQNPNTHICPICMGHPGTLPVANKEAIQKVMQVGLALQCTLATLSKFDRKNYFYPDLPKGYQISQYDLPLCEQGELAVLDTTVRITRIHLEEDTGKLAHPEGADYSLIDYNRAGIPLMELVTEPDITTGEQASKFAKELQLILRYLHASDADMEKGQMRVEANVSVRPEGTEKLGTKVEIKNLNSFRSVEQAIAYETARQTKILEDGGTVKQETRGWNEQKGETFSQREKEEAHDYRYFPEPDLPPFTFTQEEINRIKHELPELPQQRRTRIIEEYNLTAKEADVFVTQKAVGEFFEETVSELGPNLSKEELRAKVKLTANYLISDLLGLLQSQPIVEARERITPENFAELINLLDNKKITSAAAKSVLKEMLKTGADPDHIIEAQGLAQVSDESQIESIAKEIIEQNPKAVEDYKKGKTNVLQFMVGQLMAKTRGTTDPTTAQTIFERLLTE